MEQNGKPRNSPTHLQQVIFDKQAKIIHWVKDIVFKKWCRELWIFIFSSLLQTPYIMLSTKINSQLNPNLSIRPKTIRLLENNIGETLQHIGLGEDFLE